jgi:cytosine/adenosine deaminase-related metal-dependent hydrolase
MTNPLSDWAQKWPDNSHAEVSLNVCWLLNPAEPPRQNVRITVSQGIVTDISDCPPDEQHTVLPVAFLPRLINAHTHLEFSSLPEPCQPASPFTKWVESVMACRQNQSGNSASAIQAGITESLNHGTSAIGEISTTDEPPPDAALPVLRFRELIGLSPDRIDQQLQIAAQHLHSSASLVGLSPHAPYSVHPDLFESLVQLAGQAELPLTMHLAETTDEIQLLQDGTGRFVDFLSKLGLWRPDIFSPGSTIQWYLERLASLPHALAVHGNYLSRGELNYLCQQPHVGLAYCPRTHHYFGHQPHPWKQLVQSGATVVIGTDSRASNPDLSVWRELQFLARLNNTLPWSQLLCLATTNAARILNLPSVPTRLITNTPLDGMLVPCSATSESSLSGSLARPESQPTIIFHHGQVQSSG